MLFFSGNGGTKFLLSLCEHNYQPLNELLCQTMEMDGTGAGKVLSVTGTNMKIVPGQTAIAGIKMNMVKIKMRARIAAGADTIPGQSLAGAQGPPARAAVTMITMMKVV